MNESDIEITLMPKSDGAGESNDLFEKSLTSTELTLVQQELVESKSKLLEKDFLSQYDIYDVVHPQFDIYSVAKVYDFSPVHAAAVDSKIANVTELGYDLVDSYKTRDKLEKETDQEKLKKIRRTLQLKKFQLLDHLDSLCGIHDFIEIITSAYLDYETKGNGYIEIGRSTDGNIGYIGYVPAESIRVRRKRDGFVQISPDYEDAVYFRNFGATNKPPFGNDSNPNEIIQIKKRSPTNHYYGMPDIMSAQQAIAGNDFAAKYNLDYFENKAVPRHVIISRADITDQKRRNIIKWFEVGAKSGYHRTLFVKLPPESERSNQDFEIKKVENGPEEGAFNKYRESNIDEILMVHRVPRSKISNSEGASMASVKLSDKMFSEEVVRPAQKYLERVANKILHTFTDVFDFEFNRTKITDQYEQAKIDQIYLALGTIVPNEVRARWGWPGISDGDQQVQLKPQAAADRKATTGLTREREIQRNVNASDSMNQTRNDAGEGRKTA